MVGHKKFPAINVSWQVWILLAEIQLVGQHWRYERKLLNRRGHVKHIYILWICLYPNNKVLFVTKVVLLLPLRHAGCQRAGFKCTITAVNINKSL